jgi:hypothetical protein
MGTQRRTLPIQPKAPLPVPLAFLGVVVPLLAGVFSLTIEAFMSLIQIAFVRN